jgi:hypothetical protein
MGNIKRWILPVLGTILLSMTAAVPAFAQDENKDGKKASQVTFDGWVEVPGGVLPGGRYILSLSNSHSKRHTVRFYDEVSGILVATLDTIPEERNNLSKDESIRFEAGISPNPKAVKAWFHPGSRTGEQFVYLTREHEVFFVPAVQTASTVQ